MRTIRKVEKRYKKKETSVIILTIENDYCCLCTWYTRQIQDRNTYDIKWTIKVIDDRFNIFCIHKSGRDTHAIKRYFIYFLMCVDEHLHKCR